MGSSRVTEPRELDFHGFPALDNAMRGLLLGCLLWSVIGLPIAVEAVTPALTDRETVERPARVKRNLPYYAL